jgi:hypothetical protein
MDFSPKRVYKPSLFFTTSCNILLYPRHSTAFVAKETCRRNEVVKGRVSREMKERCMAVASTLL